MPVSETDFYRLNTEAAGETDRTFTRLRIALDDMDMTTELGLHFVQSVQVLGFGAHLTTLTQEQQEASASS